MVTDSADSLLALVGSWIAPIFRPLGLGLADLYGIDYRVHGKESVVKHADGAAGQFHGGAGTFVQRSDGGKSFLVFSLLYTPAWLPLHQSGEAGRQIGALIVNDFPVAVAWLVACGVYQLMVLIRGQ